MKYKKQVRVYPFAFNVFCMCSLTAALLFFIKTYDYKINPVQQPLQVLYKVWTWAYIYERWIMDNETGTKTPAAFIQTWKTLQRYLWTMNCRPVWLTWTECGVALLLHIDHISRHIHCKETALVTSAFSALNLPIGIKDVDNGLQLSMVRLSPIWTHSSHCTRGWNLHGHTRQEEEQRTVLSTGRREADLYPYRSLHFPVLYVRNHCPRDNCWGIYLWHTDVCVSGSKHARHDIRSVAFRTAFLQPRDNNTLWSKCLYKHIEYPHYFTRVKWKRLRITDNAHCDIFWRIDTDSAWKQIVKKIEPTSVSAEASNQAMKTFNFHFQNVCLKCSKGQF